MPNKLFEQIHTDPFQLNENIDETCQAKYSRSIGELSLMCSDSPEWPANRDVFLSSYLHKNRTAIVTTICGWNLTDIPHPCQLRGYSYVAFAYLIILMFNLSNYNCTLEDKIPRIISDASDQAPRRAHW